MALSPLESFVYTRDWTKPADFPTFEDDETVVRADMQFQPNELKTFINNVLVAFINTELIPLVDALVSGKVTPDSVYTAAIQKGAVTLEKLALDVTAKALGAPDKVNGVAPDASGNVTLTGDDINVSASDAKTIQEAIAGAANATDSGDGNIVVAGAAAQTAMRFLQSIIFPGLDFKFINPLHSGTHADPYGIKVGSGESLVAAINALTEPGIYTVYQNRASTDVPDGAKAINSSLRGIACLSQINKHYAFIFMVDQGSNFYIKYVQSDVGGEWKQMLPDGTGVITESKIAAGAVGTANLGGKVVTAEKIADKTVGAGQLADDIPYTKFGIAADQVRHIYTGTSETPPAEWQPGDIYLRHSV